MAPLWGSSWSSTWGSLSGYSPVQNGEQGATTTATTDSSHLKPSIGQILMSKRVRYSAISIATLGLFFLAFRNYDRLPSIESLRGGSAAAAAGSNSDCPPAVVPPFEGSQVDWSRFAYTQYVTTPAYLCNSVMIFETLFRLGSKADRVMMYPEKMMDPAETNPASEEAKLLAKARDQYNVKLVPVSVQRRAGGDCKFLLNHTSIIHRPFSNSHSSYLGRILH